MLLLTFPADTLICRLLLSLYSRGSIPAALFQSLYFSFVSSLFASSHLSGFLLQPVLVGPRASLISFGRITTITQPLNDCLQNVPSGLATGQVDSLITQLAQAEAAGKTKKRPTLQPVLGNHAAKYQAPVVTGTTR